MRHENAQAWGFVFVRCTYTSDARWKKFLAAVEHKALEQLKSVNEIPYAKDFLQRIWKFTTVEEKDKLANATLSEASVAFQEWVRSDGAPILPEGRGYGIPRWQYYIYVNEESIESVLNAKYANQLTGNLLFL